MNFDNRVLLCIAVISAHVVFAILSYDATFLNLLPMPYSLIIHRSLILIQFVTVILTVFLSIRHPYTGRLLLGIAIAIGINTVYTLDDFHGFYGSLINHEVGIVPRMRTSAYMMAYTDTGRISVLDPHGEFFLEFLIVYIISRIVDIDYILTYCYIIKHLFIALWVMIFLLIYKNIFEKTRKEMKYDHYAFLTVSSILASTIFMAAVTNYNAEQSFGAPVLTLMLLLIVTHSKDSRIKICVPFFLIAILMASMRDTLMLALISVIVMLFIFLLVLAKNMYIRRNIYIITCFILTSALTRLFQFTSLIYVKRYITVSFNVINSFLTALRESVYPYLTISKETSTKAPLQLKQILPTVTEINHVDQIYTVIAVYSHIVLLLILALFSLYSFYKDLKRRDVSHVFTLSIRIVCSLMIFLLMIDYSLSKMGFQGVLRDINVIRVLFLPLLPLIPLLTVSHVYGLLKSIRRFMHGNKMRLLSGCIVILFLLLIAMLAPQYTHVSEVKSVYDISRIKGDPNESLIFANNIYLFLISYHPQMYRVASTGDYTIDLFYTYPINYKLKVPFSAGFKHVKLINNTIFMNGFYLMTLTGSIIILQKLAR